MLIQVENLYVFIIFRGDTFGTFGLIFKIKDLIPINGCGIYWNGRSVMETAYGYGRSLSAPN